MKKEKIEFNLEAIKNYASRLAPETKVFQANTEAPAASELLTAEAAGQFLANNEGLQVWEIGVYYGLLCHKSDVSFAGSSGKRNAEIKIGSEVYTKSRLLKIVGAYKPTPTIKAAPSGNPEALRQKAEELEAKAASLRQRAEELEAEKAKTAKTVEAVTTAAAKVAEMGLSPVELKLLMKQLKQVKD